MAYSDKGRLSYFKFIADSFKSLSFFFSRAKGILNLGNSVEKLLA